MLRIGTWNTQWAKPNATLGNVVRASLSYPNCDILCVTEGYKDILPRANFVVDGGPDWGCPIVDGRRKVLLWSKRPWSDVDCVETGRPLGGRFVAGVTETDAGPLQVVGVCIPWRDAHVKYCQKDSKQWQEHERWLSAFETLRYRRATARTIVLGTLTKEFLGRDRIGECMGRCVAHSRDSRLPRQGGLQTREAWPSITSPIHRI